MLLILGEKSFCCSYLSDQSSACCLVFHHSAQVQILVDGCLPFEMASTIFKLYKNKSLDLAKELRKTFIEKYIISFEFEPEVTNGFTLLEKQDHAKLFVLSD